MFSREFRRPKRAKVKKHLKTRAKGGQIVGVRGCVPRWLLGVIRECLRASALVVHYPTKSAYFANLGAIAFPRSFNKSVLRAFWGGLFGFIGARCVFDWVRCFAWLVRLYACRVKRLRTEKRIAANFFSSCDCFCCLSCVLSCGCCLGCFAPVVCGFRLCCWWFFFPSDDCDKKKGRTVLARPLFVGYGRLNSYAVIKKLRCCCFGFF